MAEELKTIDTIDTSPFKKLVMTIGELPTSFVESMTYYELLAWLCNYLQNTVIPAVNNNAEVSEELQAKFIELRDYVNNYFTNLDVQDEINNKLDAMAEAGTLQEIITAYIQANVAWCFDTVAGMKASTNFVNGSFAQTLGYHTKNDGGTALYKVRTITNDDVVDEKFIIELADDSLIAELILINGINVKQLGAYGDNTHDDTNVFKAAFSKDHTKIYVPSGTYLISDSLNLLTDTMLCGDGYSSVIKANADFGDDYLINVPYGSYYCTIKDLYIDGDFRANGIYDGKNIVGRHYTRLHLINTRVFHCIIGLYMNAMGSMVDSCEFYGEYKNDNSGRCDTGIYVASSDNNINNSRVGCFSNYGIYNVDGGTRIVNVKSYLNGYGCYLKGEELTAVMECQENFKDNFYLFRVYGSNLTLTSGGAGVEAQTSGDLPTTFNQYAYIRIEESRNTIIDLVCDSRHPYGTETWSLAGTIISFYHNLGIDIKCSSYTFRQTSILPKLLDGDNTVGNKVVINGHEYWNGLTKRTVTLHGTSNVTLNSQTGDDYDVTISPTATGGPAFVWFDYDDWSNIAMSNINSEGIVISNIAFRYFVNNAQYTIQLAPSLLSNVTSNLGACRLISDISAKLLADETYQDFITQGATITNKSILLVCNLNTSSITNRANINGRIEVYAD